MASSMPDMLFSGKVRDTYPDQSPHTLVPVASDRISAYDVVLPDEIPGKGKVLTHATVFWLTATPVAEIMPNHLVAGPGYGAALLPAWAPEGRSLLVQKLDMLKVEAIVRGYLTGSGWKEYQKTGKVSGIELPAGMQEMEKFPEPLFTPSTKAEVGHDENIDFDGMMEILDYRFELVEEVRQKSLEIYKAGAEYALDKGIILVDTKLEFGLDPKTGKLVLADEVLTPDSSRFVKEEDYEIGKPPVSMDKQFIRDYVSSQGWNKKAPGPKLPQEIIDKTVEKYGDVSVRLTGTNPLAD